MNFILLNVLNSNLTISECENNIFTSVMSGIHFKAFKYGNIIMLRVYVTGGILTEDVFTTVATLSKYKPVEIVRTSLAGSGNTEVGTMYISVDGKIDLYPSSAGYYGAHVMYLTTDV